MKVSVVTGPGETTVMDVPKPMPPILIVQPVWVVPIHTPPVRWVSGGS